MKAAHSCPSLDKLLEDGIFLSVSPDRVHCVACNRDLTRRIAIR